MSGKGRMLKNVKKFADFQHKIFTEKYGQQLIDIFEFPVKLVLALLTLAFDIDGSAQRGFGVPELVSKLSYMSIFAVATLGTYDIALEMGKNAICQRNCGTCNGWQALRCTMCRGSGRVQYQVKNYTLRSGEKAKAECVADAIADNRAELVHLPSAINLDAPLPSKECPTCDGTYIVHSMKDPSIAAFWLFTLPQFVGGFDFDDDVKKKIWWQYKESMWYDQLRDVVAKQKPGWEQLQEALISIDPAQAKEDPVIVKNIPYYKAKKALEQKS